jgi:hypothetical protein
VVQAAEGEDALLLRVRDAGADDGADDGLDGLRALCVAHWSRHPEDGAPVWVRPLDDPARAALEEWGLEPLRSAEG